MLAPFTLVVVTILYWSISKPLYGYYKTCAIGIDSAGASFIYDVEDWTISSYTHLLARYHGCTLCKTFEWLIDALARPFEENHCEMSYEKEHLELKKERGEK